MTDRELLEHAAKAAGIYYWIDADAVVTHSDTPGSTREWNPLTDDGDALRLSVDLGLDVRHSEQVPGAWVWCEPLEEWLCEDSVNNNPYAATRRAIVRAAAEIGRSMK